MRKLLSIALAFIILLTAIMCENKKQKQLTQAKIIFSGSVAADGCGWLLEVKGEEYSPIQLEEAYKKDGLKVEVDLSYLDTGFQCGMNPDYKIPQVKIVSMKNLAE